MGELTEPTEPSTPIELTDTQKSLVKDLYNRRAICQQCIATIDQVDSSDPRRAGALEFYKKQLAEIDGRIAKLTGKPPDVVVGLKSAQLFGTPSKAG